MAGRGRSERFTGRGRCCRWLERPAIRIWTNGGAARGRLGATHIFAVTVASKPGNVSLHAEVRALASSDLLRQFDAELPLEKLAALSTSLAGVVALAFQLGTALPASVNARAYPFYAGAVGLLERDRVSYERALALLDRAAALDKQSGLIHAVRTTAFLRKFRATKDEAWLKFAAGDLDREQGQVERALEQ